MSNRTLLELNHDFAHAIDGARDRFVLLLLKYLRSGDRESAAELERYGVHVFGMRHHSDGFDIRWGGTTVHRTSVDRRSGDPKLPIEDEEMNWRPIKSAPANGDYVLIALPSGMVTIAQFCADGHWRSKADQPNTEWAPTHWRPVPDPPRG